MSRRSAGAGTRIGRGRDSRAARPGLWPALLWLAAWPLAPAAADSPALDPNVDSVVQAGRWSEAAGEGTGGGAREGASEGASEGVYRVVVVSRGFEHVSTQVLAQWKADGGEDGAARIVHEAELVAAGRYSLGPPKLRRTATGVRVELRGVATYASQARVVCRFDLAPGGKVEVVRACGE